MYEFYCNLFSQVHPSFFTIDRLYIGSIGNEKGMNQPEYFIYKRDGFHKVKPAPSIFGLTGEINKKAATKSGFWGKNRLRN
jgi:hypothetical protein